MFPPCWRSLLLRQGSFPITLLSKCCHLPHLYLTSRLPHLSLPLSPLTLPPPPPHLIPPPTSPHLAPASLLLTLLHLIPNSPPHPFPQLHLNSAPDPLTTLPLTSPQPRVLSLPPHFLLPLHAVFIMYFKSFHLPSPSFIFTSPPLPFLMSPLLTSPHLDSPLCLRLFSTPSLGPKGFLIVDIYCVFSTLGPLIASCPGTLAAAPVCLSDYALGLR